MRTGKVLDADHKESQYDLQMLEKHPRDRLDGLQLRDDSPPIPALEMFQGASQRLIAPKIPQVLLPSVILDITPSPFGRIVMHHEVGPAFGTQPTLPFVMGSSNVHLFSPHVQLDPVHSPRLRKPQYISAKLCVFHDSVPFGAILSHSVIHYNVRRA